MSKIEDIAPCLSQMTNFIALIEQQCIDEALMWMKGHGQSDFINWRSDETKPWPNRFQTKSRKAEKAWRKYYT